MSDITIVIPKFLSKITGGQKRLQISASTLGESLEQLKSLYGSELTEKLFEPTGEPKRLLNFYINGKNARLQGFLEAELREGDEVIVIPSVSGG